MKDDLKCFSQAPDFMAAGRDKDDNRANRRTLDFPLRFPAWAELNFALSHPWEAPRISQPRNPNLPSVAPGFSEFRCPSFHIIVYKHILKTIFLHQFFTCKLNLNTWPQQTKYWIFPAPVVGSKYPSTDRQRSWEDPHLRDVNWAQFILKIKIPNLWKYLGNNKCR